MENNSNRIESVSAQNIVDESLKEESISWASEVVLPLTNQTYDNTLMSFLGRVQYSLRDKYLLPRVCVPTDHPSLPAIINFLIFPLRLLRGVLMKNLFEKYR